MERVKVKTLQNYFKMDDIQNKKTSIEERTLKLESIIVETKKSWGEKIQKIIKMIKNVNELSEAQVLMLSYRHQIVDAITDIQFKLYRMQAYFDSEYRKKYRSYTLQYDIKLNGGEKDKFVRAELAPVKRQIQIVEAQVDFYRECIRTLDNLGFAIKRRMEIATEFM
jgi:hypothetical protein